MSDIIWGHNPILTSEKKKILGLTMPQPLEARHSTISPQAIDDIISFDNLNSTSTLEPPNPPLQQSQWFPGEDIIASICNKEINSNCSTKYIVVINGTVSVSVVTRDPISVIFVVKRINQAKLISGSFTIGECLLYIF